MDRHTPLSLGFYNFIVNSFRSVEISKGFLITGRDTKLHGKKLFSIPRKYLHEFYRIFWILTSRFPICFV